MSIIKVNLDYPIEDGAVITFKAPCNSEDATALNIYYPNIMERTRSIRQATFTFDDANKYDLKGIPNLFVQGAYVTVILDTNDNIAYIQNANTNAYLEDKFNYLENWVYLTVEEDGCLYGIRGLNPPWQFNLKSSGELEVEIL